MQGFRASSQIPIFGITSRCRCSLLRSLLGRICLAVKVLHILPLAALKTILLFLTCRQMIHHRLIRSRNCALGQFTQPSLLLAIRHKSLDALRLSLRFSILANR